jgi:hypothetical protein
MKKSSKKNQVTVIITPSRVETRNGWETSEDCFNVVVVEKNESVKVYGMEKALEVKSTLEKMYNK